MQSMHLKDTMMEVNDKKAYPISLEKYDYWMLEFFVNMITKTDKFLYSVHAYILFDRYRRTILF